MTSYSVCKGLKKCPFHNKEDDAICYAFIYSNKDGSMVVCDNCDARGPVVERSRDTSLEETKRRKAKAKELWNTRTVKKTRVLIKLCPFCKGTPGPGVTDIGGYKVVSCLDCGARSPLHYYHSTCIDSWNKRRCWKHK